MPYLTPAEFGEELKQLLSEEGIVGSSKITSAESVELPVSDIEPNPYQPRKHFDEKKLQELSESIALHGVFTPILVKESQEGGYILIAGERRLRASKLVGLKTIPAIIIDLNDGQMREIALLENIQREDLNVIEEANGYQEIIQQLGYTQEQLAKRIGKSREHVTNTLRLLKLPETIQEYAINGSLSMGHIRSIAGVHDPKTMEELARKAADEKLSVRAVESLVKKHNEPNAAAAKAPQESQSPYSELENEIRHLIHTKVKITKKQIILDFYDERDLERIVNLLRKIR